MVTDFIQYKDPECRDESKDESFEMQRDYYLFLANTVIQSKDCIFPIGNEPWGIKSRGYC